MAVTFVAAGAGAADDGSPVSIDVPYPAELAADDLLIAQIFSRNNISTIGSPPAGWTLLFGPDTETARQWLYYKFSDGTETGTEQWSISGAALFMGRMYAFRGVALSSFTEGGSASTGTDDSVECPSVTTTGTDEMAVAFVSVADDNALSDFTGESGGNYTEAVAEYTSSLGLDGAIGLQTAAMASAGTVSGGSFTMAASDAWIVRAFALTSVAATTVPDAPTLVDLVPGDGEIDLAWEAPADDGGAAITNYKIYRGTSSGSLSLLDTVGNVLTYNDATPSNGTMYFYTVAAVNSVGEGAESNELSGTPYAITSGLITLCVGSTAEGCTLFFIGTGLSEGDNYGLYEVNEDPEVANDSSIGAALPADEFGRVQWDLTSVAPPIGINGEAIIHSGGAGKDKRISNTTPFGWLGTQSPCPGDAGDGDNDYVTAPILVRDAGDEQVSLDWTASTPCDATALLDEVEYLVQRSTTGPTSGFSTITTVGTTDHLDTGLTNGTTYWYRIRAQANWMVSDLYGVARFADSNVVSATPQESSISVALNVRVPMHAPPA